MLLDTVGMIPPLGEDAFIPSALITPVGQDRLILPCSGSGDPELQSGGDAIRYSPALQGGRHNLLL